MRIDLGSVPPDILPPTLDTYPPPKIPYPWIPYPPERTMEQRYSNHPPGTWDKRYHIPRKDIGPEIPYPPVDRQTPVKT